MKRNLLIFLITLYVFIPCLLMSQYEYMFVASEGNPGKFNQDEDIINPMPGTGWTVLYNNSSATPQWSSPVTIPFDFNFNSKIVTSFKVSNSGVLTFDVNSNTVPSYSNLSLPSSEIPDNSVCVLGLQGQNNYSSIILNTSARKPIIRTKIYGTEEEKNRQMWISFTAFSAQTIDSNKAFLANWSIVLEETSNFIYIVDHCTFSYTKATGGFKSDTLNTHLTLGVQIEGNSAVSITGSPDIGSKVLNPKIGTSLSFVPVDNVYYIFIPTSETQNYDVSVSKINLGEYTNGRQSGINISGTLNNFGVTINSVQVHFSINEVKQKDTTLTGLEIPFGKSFNITTALWKPENSGKYKVMLWCDNINGNNTDGNSDNDTCYVLTNYMMNPPHKKVLLEEFTGTWCGNCPRGISAMNYTLDNLKDAIGYSFHVANDPMKNFYSDSITLFYPGGYPSGMVDRKTFNEDGEFKPTLEIPMSNYWIGVPFAEKTSKLLEIPTPVSVSINSNYNPVTRELVVKLTATFEAEAIGDFRMNAVLVEDSVTGDSQYDQKNYMAGDTAHPYWGKQPGSIQNFVHRHVARCNLAENDFLGTPGIIPDSVAVGQSFSKNYSFILPQEWNADKIELVGFVTKYFTDNTKGYVMNTEKIKIGDNPLEITDKDILQIPSIQVFPNPSSTKLSVKFMMLKPSQTKIEIFNLSGIRVFESEYGLLSEGPNTLELNVSDLSTGVYYLKIATVTYIYSQFFSVFR